MLLTYNKNNPGEESIDFRAQMTEAELNYLVNFAIQVLMQTGAIAVQTGNPEPQEVDLPITEAIVPKNEIN